MAVREERQKQCKEYEMRISEKSYISLTCNIPSTRSPHSCVQRHQSWKWTFYSFPFFKRTGRQAGI